MSDHIDVLREYEWVAMYITVITGSFRTVTTEEHSHIAPLS